MNRSGERIAAARVAVIGAPSVEGAHVREALARRGVPGARVDLYGTTNGEVLLSEYAGEARMIQEPELDEVARHELIFLCEPGELAGAVALAAPSSVIIDLGNSLPAATRPRPVHLDVAIDVASGADRFSVPHALSLAVAEMLAPLDGAFGIGEAIAVILRPAADFGDQGVEELREQTVRLLNFAKVPVETFGRQLAFNVIPGASTAGGTRELNRRIEREVAELLAWSEPRFAVKLVTTPVFHGHGLQLRFRLSRSASLEDVRGALAGTELVERHDAATPLDVIGEERTCVSDLSEDGLGAFWLWGVAGETGSRGAHQAVRLAAALFDL